MIDKTKPNYLEQKSTNEEALLCEHIFEFMQFRLKQLKRSFGMAAQSDKQIIVGAINEINLLTENFNQRYKIMKAREFKQLEKDKKNT